MDEVTQLPDPPDRDTEQKRNMGEAMLSMPASLWYVGTGGQVFRLDLDSDFSLMISDREKTVATALLTVAREVLGRSRSEVHPAPGGSVGWPLAT